MKMVVSNVTSEIWDLTRNLQNKYEKESEKRKRGYERIGREIACIKCEEVKTKIEENFSSAKK